MMTDVVNFTGITKLDILPEKALREAIDEDLDGVVIIGWKDGLYFASSVAESADTLFMIERAKHELMKLIDNELDGM